MTSTGKYHSSIHNKNRLTELGLKGLTPLSTIVQFFIGGGTRVPGENHKPATIHSPTLSDNVVSSTPYHVRNSNSQP
jgi:hypothetical protein